MKRADLIRHVESQGCVFVREGAKIVSIAIQPTDNPQQSLAIVKSRSTWHGKSATISASQGRISLRVGEVRKQTAEGRRQACGSFGFRVSSFESACGSFKFRVKANAG
jgi:hypothetical protein